MINLIAFTIVGIISTPAILMGTSLISSQVDNPRFLIANACFITRLPEPDYPTVNLTNKVPTPPPLPVPMKVDIASVASPRTNRAKPFSHKLMQRPKNPAPRFMRINPKRNKCYHTSDRPHYKRS